jgi:hypothetical protein
MAIKPPPTLTEREARQLLEMTARASQMPAPVRTPFILERLMAMTSADVGMISRVDQDLVAPTAAPAIKVLAQRGEVDLLRRARSQPSSCAPYHFVFALAHAKRFACLTLCRNDGLDPRRQRLADLAWRSLGHFHDDA